MIVYILGTFITIFIATLAVSNTSEKRTKNMLMFLSTLPLTFISGLRYGVGQDYFYTYVPAFNSILNSGTFANYEFGFLYLNKFIQFFTTDYIYLFLICAVFFSYFTFKTIYKYSKDPVLSIFLLICTQYYFIYLNGMRQMIAVSIFLYSFRYIKEKKIVKYLLLNLIGFSFHSSAIIAIPFYFFANIKLSPKKSILILISTIGVSGLLRQSLINIILGTKYAIYISSVYDNGSKGYIVMTIELVVLLLGLFFYPKNDKTKDKEYIKEYNIYSNAKLLSVILACLNGFLPLITRVKWYFGFSTIIFIPLILDNIKEKKLKNGIKVGIIFFYAIYIFYTVGLQNANKVLPYVNIFER
ncbi:MAG: EpsG family protein [Bacilli bacterium]|nr:EpsG family protein [Bacilli bacterium]